jgi:tetratricopeptide (TPR) repeat protein
LNQQSARVRIEGEAGEVTFRSADLVDAVPGHVATCLKRRWTWRGDEYASGKVERLRIDVAKLRLEPLPLEGGELEDIRGYSEPFTAPDPYAPLWRSSRRSRGYGLCLWRLGRLDEARKVFERILALNPNELTCRRTRVHSVERLGSREGA